MHLTFVADAARPVGRYRRIVGVAAVVAWTVVLIAGAAHPAIAAPPDPDGLSWLEAPSSYPAQDINLRPHCASGGPRYQSATVKGGQSLSPANGYPLDVERYFVRLVLERVGDGCQSFTFSPAFGLSWGEAPGLKVAGSPICRLFDAEQGRWTMPNTCSLQPTTFTVRDCSSGFCIPHTVTGVRVLADVVGGGFFAFTKDTWQIEIPVTGSNYDIPISIFSSNNGQGSSADSTTTSIDAPAFAWRASSREFVEYSQTGGPAKYGLPSDMPNQDFRGYTLDVFAAHAMSIERGWAGPFMVADRILEAWAYETAAGGDHLGAPTGRPVYNYNWEYWQQPFEHGFVTEEGRVCYRSLDPGPTTCYYPPRLPI